MSERSEQVDFPRGHAGNPMTDDEVENKFRRLAKGVVSAKVQDAILNQAWGLDKAKDVRGVWRFSTRK